MVGDDSCQASLRREQEERVVPLLPAWFDLGAGRSMPCLAKSLLSHTLLSPSRVGLDPQSYSPPFPSPPRLSSSFMAASKADLLPYFASALMTTSRPHRPIFMAWELKNNNQNNKNNAFSHECLSIEPCGSSVGVSGMKAKKHIVDTSVFPVSCPCCTLLPRLHAV